MDVQTKYISLYIFSFSVTLGKANASSYVHATINLKTSGKEEEEDGEKMSMPCLIMTKIMKPLSFLKLHDQTFKSYGDLFGLTSFKFRINFQSI